MIRFKTITGSVYEIDTEHMRWARVTETENSGYVRGETGLLVDIPEVNLGCSVIMICPPVDDRYVGRLIITGAVMEVEKL
jgi:hypothetical protein